MPKISIILVLLPLTVLSHCMLDMLLNYESNLDSKIKIFPMLEQAMTNLKQKSEQMSLPNLKFNWMKIMTNNFDKQTYAFKINSKNNELSFNISRILKQYCQKIDSDLVFTQKLDLNDPYLNYKARCNLGNNNLQYHLNGRFEMMVKEMKIINYNGVSLHDNMMTLFSRVATQLRARECLLNPQAYNVMNEKFKKINNIIKERTSALDSVLQDKPFSFINLDSVSSIDCKYFTPDTNNPTKGVDGVTSFTKFYMAYPLMDGNLENLFFFDPKLLVYMTTQGLKYKNNLSLRLNIMYKLVESLESLHQMGFIHKNIKLQNIFFKYFPKNNSKDTNETAYVSFGDFSLSGIDDYDARLKKNFYVPDDEKTEIGPKIDIYKLGLVFFQILYMVPVERTPEMTLSKIAKMTDPNQFISFNGRQIQLFEKLMMDVINNRFNPQDYTGTMSITCANCCFQIFKQIHKYFDLKIYSNYDKKHNQLMDSMYYYKPEENELILISKLYLNQRFKSYFMSIFLSLYGISNECGGSFFQSQTVKVLLNGMLAPFPNLRSNLKMIRKNLYDALSNVESNPHQNLIYQAYDINLFYKGDNYVSLLSKQKSERLI